MNYLKIAEALHELALEKIETTKFSPDCYQTKMELDNYQDPQFDQIRYSEDPKTFTRIAEQLHVLEPKFEFRIQNWNMAGTDLVITNIACKKAYESLPKPYTIAELQQVVFEKFGIQTTGFWQGKLNRRITEKEYNDQLSFYASVDNILGTYSDGATKKDNR